MSWTHRLTLLVLMLAACSGPEAADDIGIARDLGVPADVAADAGVDADVHIDDLGVDSGRADLGTVDAAVDSGTSCEALNPADCIADESCTLDDECRAAQPDDPLFGYALSGIWNGSAETSGAAGLPVGEVDASLSLFHDDDRNLRGLLLFAGHDVVQRVWGGVGPTGALGLSFGPPECDDQTRCGATFDAALTAGGFVDEERLDVVDVERVGDVVDEVTFTSLRLAPSDGFKPVNPLAMRTEPLHASWSGDVGLVESDGRTRLLSCTFQIDVDQQALSMRNFECVDSGPSTLPVFQTADAASLAYADGVAWFAVGPGDDDPLFVGRVGLDGPWEGVIVPRAPTWTDGAPVDPADLDIEALRGTFKFFGLPLN